jgi:hypothetical protein
MNLTTFTVTPAAASANNIALSQTASGAGNVTLNGAAVSGGVATLDIARRVGIASTSTLTSLTFTLTGTDRYGYTQSETITGPNNSTVVSTLDYKTITNISISGSTTGNSFTVGTVATNGAFTTPWYVGDYRTGKPLLAVINVTGTINYTVQYTQESLNDQSLTVAQQIARLQNPDVFSSTDTNVVTATTDQSTTFIMAVPGVRVLVNSYSTGATLKVTFQSPNNATA